MSTEGHSARTLRLALPLMAAALLLPIYPAQAHETRTSSRWLVKNSDLIFRGVVTGVQYRVSDVIVPNQDIPVPHTFVTFRIDRVFKGRSATQGNITIRLQGGLDAVADEILQISGVPLFDVGETVVLFVRGNTRRLCPVQGWNRGRFRIVGGYVYTEFGQEVWITANNEFVMGPSHPLPEVVNRSVNGSPFVLDMSPVQSWAWTPPAGARRASADALAAMISKLVSELHTAAELANLPPMPSAFLNEPLVIKEAQAAPPPAGK